MRLRLAATLPLWALVPLTGGHAQEVPVLPAPAATPGQPAPGPAPVATPAPVFGPLLRGEQPRQVNGPLDLVTAYDLGERNDATFRAALAERDANRATANQTISGYLPTASYSYQNIPTESGARHVATVTQPIVSLTGLATIRQRGPRRRYADATLDVRAQDLAVRLMTSVTDLIKAREASTLNNARIDALKTQSERAERLYKGGLGTITDARDIQVRYQQAQANRILLRSDEAAAEARLGSITGVAPGTDAFVLPKALGSIELEPLATYLASQAQENPQVLAARESERIGKLEADRIRSSFVPTLGASATYTRFGGRTGSFVGFSINAPLNAGTFFQTGAANAGARRAVEERRQVEERAKVELSRLYALVDGGRQALAINLDAIQAAELSVTANEKSYEGGVRTNVDVVNAIQTRFEVQNTFVQSAAQLATNYLNLLLLAGESPEYALGLTQRFLLGR